MRSNTAADLRGRCPRCFVLSAYCVCSSIPSVETSSRFIIVRHAKEAWRSTNTGRLAALALPNSEILALGLEKAPLQEGLFDPRDTWLLFPGDVERTSFQSPPRRVIVLDGSWSQARRMAQRVFAFSGLPRLSLGGPSRATEPQRLRRSTVPDGMSTLEAIARAVSVIDGRDRAKPLDTLHQIFVEHVLRARGVRMTGA